MEEAVAEAAVAVAVAVEACLRIRTEIETEDLVVAMVVAVEDDLPVAALWANQTTTEALTGVVIRVGMTGGTEAAVSAGDVNADVLSESSPPRTGAERTTLHLSLHVLDRKTSLLILAKRETSPPQRLPSLLPPSRLRATMQPLLRQPMPRMHNAWPTSSGKRN